MKLVFAHDHLFKEDNQGNFYTAGSFNNKVWNRYLIHFDELTVIARLDKNKVNTNNTYNNFDLDKTSFIPIPSLSGPIAQFKNRKNATQKIKDVLKESDALIARLPSEIGNLAIDIAKQMEKPYAIEVVACVWDALWNYGSLQAKLYAPIAMNKMKKRVSESPYTLYVTNEFLQRRYPSYGKNVAVSNVEIDEVSENILVSKIYKTGKKEEAYKIGMIGNLNNRIKGWDIALKALHLLNQKGINIEFHVLGDGDRTKWIEMAKSFGIDNKIIFHGVLPGGKPVFQWLDSIDIYIQPSFQEGLPRAVIEAMSRGCPVVGSTAGGIPELLDKSYLHKPGDYKMLANIIENIISNSEFTKKISMRNFEESKRFKKNILDTKRYNFWSSFVTTFDKK